MHILYLFYEQNHQITTIHFSFTLFLQFFHLRAYIVIFLKFQNVYNLILLNTNLKTKTIQMIQSYNSLRFPNFLFNAFLKSNVMKRTVRPLPQVHNHANLCVPAQGLRERVSQIEDLKMSTPLQRLIQLLCLDCPHILLVGQYETNLRIHLC